jgi:hypothetical protein
MVPDMFTWRKINMIKYIHDPYNKLCIGYEPASNSMPVGKSSIFKMTTAICHPGDQYVKKMAREQVDYNMANDRCVLVRLPKDVQPNVYFKQISALIGTPQLDYMSW